ncbi:MAG TPA: protein translocase subunit SecF [Candidatus Limnocylindrales bacterium]|nr:protein translocase subunit SecF [Candidatus Limnocylindrales bacterium]
MPVFDLVGKRRWFYIFSALITIPGLIFILLTPFSNGQAGLKFSIDFTGGTVWEIHFANGRPDPTEVHEVMLEQGLPGTVAITTAAEREYVLIRTERVSGLTEQPAASPGPSAAPSGSPAASSASPSGSPSASGSPAPSASASPAPSASAEASVAPSPSASPGAGGPINLPTEGDLGELRFALEDRFGPIDEVRQEANIGPIISSEITQQAIILIILGSAGILGWMTFRFQDFRMGAAAIVALLHDVLVVVGVFAIGGTFFGLEVDALFVTAMLTVIGFSVHDTIVVFDRVRENRVRHAGESFSSIVNHSLLQTLGRSLNTSITVGIVLLALLLFGSDAIRAFVFAMVIGIISGTYSSIFNASMILVSWHERDDERRQQQFATARG